MKMDELVDGGVTRRAAIAGGVAALVAPVAKSLRRRRCRRLAVLLWRM